MIKSMTGFSKTEASEKGNKITVEIKSLNGKYLEISCKLPRSISQKEFEVREIIRSGMNRGSVSVSINLETDQAAKAYNLNEEAAIEYFKKLNSLKGKLKLKENITLDHILHFSDNLNSKEDDSDAQLYWRLAQKALREGVKTLDKMRRAEGQNISKDIHKRMNNIKTTVAKVEKLGQDRIPEEREKLRQRVAMLFESDEIDENRIQMEMVMLADKLDISEECVRLNSHFKFFFEIIKAAEPSGRKINFLLQEMHREINTIGSKANDAKISQLVVNIKEELERVREQVQNIE